MTSAGVCVCMQVCVCVCVEVLWYSYHGTALMVCALFNKSAVSEVDICCMCGVCLCVWGGVGVCKRLAGKLVCERAVCVLCDRKVVEGSVTVITSMSTPLSLSSPCLRHRLKVQIRLINPHTNYSPCLTSHTHTHTHTHARTQVGKANVELQALL